MADITRQHLSRAILKTVIRPMGSGDWFRNGDWSPQIEADFQARLGRTHSQRDQYLVIQAITIESSHPKAALRLIEQYFATKTSDSHDVRALNARASAYIALGDDENAIRAMKQVLGIESIPTLPDCQ